MAVVTTAFSCIRVGMAVVVSLAALASNPAQAQSANATFFVTGIGNGGNLGGLAGADNHCQSLAQAASITGKT